MTTEQAEAGHPPDPGVIGPLQIYAEPTGECFALAPDGQRFVLEIRPSMFGPGTVVVAPPPPPPPFPEPDGAGHPPDPG